MNTLETVPPIGQAFPSADRFVPVNWTKHQDPYPREFDALVCPGDDDEGGYSVFALNYPGVISEGETIEEAKTNIAEAFIAMLESRRKHGENMVFSDRPVVEETRECERFRVTIDG